MKKTKYMVVLILYLIVFWQFANGGPIFHVTRTVAPTVGPVGITCTTQGVIATGFPFQSNDTNTCSSATVNDDAMAQTLNVLILAGVTAVFGAVIYIFWRLDHKTKKAKQTKAAEALD